MNISIIDKFISTSIINIQKLIAPSKKDIPKEKFKILKSEVLKLKFNNKINNQLFELIDLTYMIYKSIYVNKMKIKHKNSSINNIILSTVKNYNIIKSLVKDSDIKTLYDKLESDNSFYEIKNIIDELGTDNLNIILMNKATQSEYILFFLIYKFIYLKLYRSKIYYDGELFILQKNKKKETKNICIH